MKKDDLYQFLYGTPPPEPGERPRWVGWSIGMAIGLMLYMVAHALHLMV